MSYANVDADLVIPIAQNLLEICHEQSYKDNREYFQKKYYTDYARWNNFLNKILKFFHFKPIHIRDFETCFEEFYANPTKHMTIHETFEYIDATMQFDILSTELRGILSVAEASKISGTQVYLSKKHCKLLGFGHGLVPPTNAEVERNQAIQELNNSQINSVF